MRRIAKRILATAALSLVSAAGCGFPGLSYDAADAAAAADATEDQTRPEDARAEAARDASSPRDAVAPDADAAPDASFDDAGASPDAAPDAPPGDAAGDAPPGDAAAHDAAVDAPPSLDGGDCDMDKDGYKAAGGSCGGNDCCDTDPNANPGQTMYFPAADGCGSFDFNCDGKLETEFLTNVTCGFSGFTCAGGPGFASNPACGTSAPYESCGVSGFSCVAMPGTNTTQACH